MPADSHSYIGVVVALPVEQVYTYHVPEHLVHFVSIGKRVLVPFGKRKVTGYVWQFQSACRGNDAIDIKSVFDVLDEEPLFPDSMVPFFEWISDYYMYPLGEVVKSSLPGGINPIDISFIKITEKGVLFLKSQKKPASTVSIELEILNQVVSEPLTLKKISEKTGRVIPNSYIYGMEKKELVTRQTSVLKGRIKEKTEKFICLTHPDFAFEGLPEKKKEILWMIAHQKEMAAIDLRKLFPSFSSYMSGLEKSGYISIYEKKMYRDPFGEAISSDQAPVLSEEQANAVMEIENSLEKGYANFLLFGVTGSGKTEVYMHVCETAIKKGLSSLVLVPEIALISQTEKRFRARFGDRVAVLHSGLSPGEKYDQWLRIIRDETPIVIGARSAVFAPLKRPGIIIVDEEHDVSYKQDNNLRYNARDLAIVRAKQTDCIVVLGSATPSVQSYYNSSIGKSSVLTLERRINRYPLPDIKMVDLRTYRDADSDSRLITPILRKAIQETLDRNEQIILFLNRRGFANFPVCAACGESLRCRNCDITLTLHKKANAYRCHFCGFSMASVSSCRICGSSNIKILGHGTERVEKIIKSIFPGANVDRLDQDTVSYKGALIKVLKKVKEKRTDILIGTQMIAKGHDFPGITLVGIICADLSLNFPDFRSGVRTFQLIAQVAGRAGRGNRPGRVILQTYAPEHFSIDAAKEQDFLKFYDKEILFRKSLGYPPFSRMTQLRISAKDKKNGQAYTLLLGDFLKDAKNRHAAYKNTIIMLGPIEAPLHKIANRYRWQILLKSVSVKLMHQFLGDFLNSEVYRKRQKDLRVTIDVDPFFLM
ncbi:MAG: primosomal protein N' [Proteobacteria bacterium]|nr:primosomal protein N' [Pseudomonadota bacterium]